MKIKLNPQQKAAVASNDTNIVVIAGPGSGKTRVLVLRIVDRVKKGALPSRIVVLTFTNAAARELNTRLTELGITVGYVGTLHGYCFRLIQEYGESIGYRAGSVSIIPPAAVEQMVTEIAIRLGVKMSYKRLLEAADGREASLVWKEYRHLAKRSNMVDYDGILQDGLKIVLDKRFSVDDFYVDESQDSGDEDWAIYQAFPAVYKFFIGDCDQSIYAFRKGKPELLVNCAKTATLFKLEVNYRSDSAICDAANRLISHNTGRIHKDAVPESKKSGSVRIYEYQDDFHEIGAVINDVKNCVAAGMSVAVLVRLNRLAEEYRRALGTAGVKVQTDGARQFPTDWETAMLVVSIMHDPNDIVVERFLRITKNSLDVNRMKLRAIADRKSLAEVHGLTKNKFTLADVGQKLASAGVGEEAIALVNERIDGLPQSEPTLADLLQDLFSAKSWGEPDKGEPGVFVGTIHAAKGKEWDAVFMPAMEEGILPFKNSDIEEERRLAFVGMTRARHTLIVSSCRTRANIFSGRAYEAVASRFLKEMIA